MKNKQKEIKLLLNFIDTAYDKKSWHGTNLKGSIRGLNFKQASWRPAKNRHNIFELVLHAAYWKYVVTRRLTNSKRGTFPIKGSNWFSIDQVSKIDWENAKKILNKSHLHLKSAITKLKLDDLSKKTPQSKINNLTLIMGVAAHDFYHAGQIQLIKKLMRK